jgi:hypothetical protein
MTDETGAQRTNTALWEVVVKDLTAAARGSGRRDFADFLASVLVAVTANVGGVDRLLAGRSGSWEAGLVRQLVEGAVGYDQDGAGLALYRTEPVVVPLNVHNIMFDNAVAQARANRIHDASLDTPCEVEISEIWERIASREIWEAGEYDATLAQVSAEAAAATAKWAAKYAAYAEAFAAAVAQEASQIKGLRVPVTLRANTSADGADANGLYDEDAENPDEYDPDVDPLVWRLWNAASQAAPLPTSATTNPTPAEAPSDAGSSRITVAGFTVLIERTASGSEATS